MQNSNPDPELDQNLPKTRFYQFSKIMIFMFFINLYRNGPGAPNPINWSPTLVAT